MEQTKKFYELSKIKQLLGQLKSRSHAVLLQSKDELFLRAFAKLLILDDMCQSGEQICFECANCKKVLNSNAIDVEFFGQNKPLVVEDSQQIIADSYVVPLEFENKYFVIEQIDKATLPAQNKLLKVVEEPQSFDKFILTTTNIDAVLPTIKSRCQVVVLPKLSGEELGHMFGQVLNDAQHFVASVAYADGSLAQLMQIYGDQNFLELHSLTLDMLKNMQNSAMVLHYSSKIAKFKGCFEQFLQILNLFFSDLLCIKNGKHNLVANKQAAAELQVLAKNYSTLAIVSILNYIVDVMNKKNFNLNQNGLIDEILLKILEIKYICK